MTSNTLNEEELQNMNNQELSYKKEIKDLQDQNQAMRAKLNTLENEKRDKINSLMKQSQINYMETKEAEMQIQLKNDEIETLKGNLSKLQEELIRSRNMAGLGAPKIDASFHSESDMDGSFGLGNSNFKRQHNDSTLSNEPKPPTPPSSVPNILNFMQANPMASMLSNPMMAMQMQNAMQLQNNMMLDAMNRAPSVPNMGFMNMQPQPMNMPGRPMSTGQHVNPGMNINFQQNMGNNLTSPPMMSPQTQNQSLQPGQPQMNMMPGATNMNMPPNFTRSDTSSTVNSSAMNHPGAMTPNQGYAVQPHANRETYNPPQGQQV